MSERVVNLVGDWSAVAVSAHDTTLSLDSWCTELLKSTESVLRPSHGIAITLLKHSADCSSAEARTISTSALSAFTVAADGGLAMLGIDGFKSFWYPKVPVTTHSEIEVGLPPDVVAGARAARAASGIVDMLGVVVHPEPGVAIVLGAMHRDALNLTRQERSLLTRVAMHLETSYRLRLRGDEIVKAELDASGKILHRSNDAPPASVISAHAAAMNTARADRSMSSSESLALWPALVAGNLSFVARRVNGRQRYLLVENAPASQLFRALTPAEVDVVSHASRGLTTKMISYALGISSSAVSSLLSSAALKIGVSSRLELVRLAAMLVRDPRARFAADFSLTDAERDVLELLNRGLSNDEIAAMRSRSVRTIANQVASLLRKTNSTSRRDLAVRTSAADSERADDDLESERRARDLVAAEEVL